MTFSITSQYLDSLRRRAASARRRHDDAAQAGICTYLPKLPIEEEYERAQGTGWANPQGTGKSLAKPLVPAPTPLQVIGALLRIIENARWAILAIDQTGDTSRDLEEAPRTSGWEDLLRSLRKEEQESYNLRRGK
jgi:hypothetical protein